MISLILVSFGIQQDLFVPVSNGADRCESVDCLCEIKPPEAFVNEVSALDVMQFSVFFAEASSQLSQADVIRIEKSISLFPRQGRVLIEGHADGCGSLEFNRDLSGTRSLQIAQVIRRVRPDLSIRSTFDGEVTPQHDELSRRVDVKIDESGNRSWDPERYTADFYLVDNSGSMSGTFSRWMSAISLGKRITSRVFLSRAVACAGEMWQRNMPLGPTEIWYSYWKILDLMSPGEDLLIISDFDSALPLSDWERRVIEQKVVERGVKARSIIIR